MQKYITQIEEIWQTRDKLAQNPNLELSRRLVEDVILALNCGKVRVAEKIGNKWVTNEWIKKAILLYFQMNTSKSYSSGCLKWYDKIPLKYSNTSEHDFQMANYRLVPGSFIRIGAFIANNVVIMPSFVNIGAYIGEGSLVDTWATIGSCAQIGKNCHISGGTGIGGVLEPIQASPVIIEDNCFIGARSEIVEGVIVEEGAVISMGVFIGSSTKIVDRNTGEVMYGRVPAYSVVVPGTLPSLEPTKPSLYCAVIVKQVDEVTRSKTSINELLRN